MRNAPSMTQRDIAVTGAAAWIRECRDVWIVVQRKVGVPLAVRRDLSKQRWRCDVVWAIEAG